MESLKLCMFLFMTSTIVCGFSNVIQYEMAKLEEKEELDIENWWREKVLSPRKPVRLQKWGYTDCGGGDSMLTVKSLSIGPDPVVVPGPLNVAASIDAKSDLVSPLKGNVTMLLYSRLAKKYLKVPCIANFGSCVYDDVCALLGQITQCPDALKNIGLTCHCPIKTQTYTLPQTTFDLDASVFPSGDFNIIGNLTYNGKEAACLNITISFEG